MESERGFEYYTHALFEAGVALKAFNGAWETLTGLFILFVPRDTLMYWFSVLAQRELLEDPHDRFVDTISRLITNTPDGTRLFVTIYILAHGVVNLFLAYNLYRQRLWAYPAAAVILGLFIIYQIERIYLHHSVTLIILTLIDVIFLALILHEYSRARGNGVRI
ncbi:MAG: DUF2127 domain-containing protein [Minisyncoccia bacterium]